MKYTTEQHRGMYNQVCHHSERDYYWTHHYNTREVRLMRRIPDDSIEVDTRDQYYLSMNMIGIGP